MTTLTAIKLAHTVVTAVLAGLIVYALWRGVVGGDRRGTWIALAVVGVEAVVLTANGCTCPLYDLAARHAGPGEPVDDIYLPRWAADRIVIVFAPLFVAALGLNVWRAVWRRG